MDDKDSKVLFPVLLNKPEKNMHFLIYRLDWEELKLQYGFQLFNIDEIQCANDHIYNITKHQVLETRFRGEKSLHWIR